MTLVSSTSTAATTRRPGGTVSGRTRAGLIALVAGATVLCIARALANEGGSPAQRLDQMNGHDLQVTLASLCAIIGFAALAPGLLTVAAEVRDRGSRLATTGCGLVVVGSVGFAILAALDIVTLAATHASSRPAMEDYLHQLDSSPGIIAVTIPAVLGYFFGPFLVVLGCRRAGFVPRWLPWAVLAVLVLQPVAAGAGGPAVARVVDTAFQLVLVGLVVVLVRATREQHLRSA
jgi:hypothetical protein